MSTTTTARPDRANPARPAAARPHAVRDTWLVLTRELRPMIRDPFTVIFSLLQPLVFLGLFAPLLVVQSGQSTPEVLAWFLPGVLVMTVLFGTGATGSNLQYEMMFGSHERTLVAPIARSALLVGRALKEIVPIVAQSLVIVAIALPFGYRAHALGLVLGLVLLAIFGVGLGSLSYALALATRSKEWAFWAVQQSLIFPLLILSGVLLPLDGAPGWMRGAAAVNPVSWVTAGERALLQGDLGSPQVAWAFLAAVALAAVGLLVGIRAIRRTD